MLNRSTLIKEAAWKKAAEVNLYQGPDAISSAFPDALIREVLTDFLQYAIEHPTLKFDELVLAYEHSLQAK